MSRHNAIHPCWMPIGLCYPCATFCATHAPCAVSRASPISQLPSDSRFSYSASHFPIAHSPYAVRILGIMGSRSLHRVYYQEIVAANNHVGMAEERRCRNQNLFYLEGQPPEHDVGRSVATGIRICLPLQLMSRSAHVCVSPFNWVEL